MADLETLLLPPLLALLLCVHLGYAFGLLALPPDLRPYRALVTPLAGCALFLVITASLTTLTALTPPLIAAVLAALAVPLNGWAFWRGRRSSMRQPLVSLVDGEALPLLACGLLAILVFALAVLPPLRWGASTPIGSNWDAAEFYVPLARALQLRSQHDIATLPGNPLIQIVTTPPVSGRIHAFSYLHAAVSSATAIEPLRSYAPMMAFVLALQPLALYPLARVLGLARGAAVLATALLALAWLPLWVTYNNFSNHLMALPLLPIALAAGLVALRRDGWRALATGALFVAALATGYYPAMTAYVALFGPAALYLLWRAENRSALLRRGLALVALSFVLSGAAQDFFFLHDGFRGEITRNSTGFQINRFVELPDALGLAATFNRESLPGDARLVVPAVALAVLLGAAALAGRRMPLLAAMAVGAAAYQLLTAARAYHYGFYKGVTFEIPIYATLIAAGAALVWERAARLSRGRSVARGALAAGVALILVLNASTIWRVQQRYSAAGPQLWSAAETDMAEISAQVPPDATVLVVPSDAHAPTFNSLISYALLGHTLLGQFKTGYGALDTSGDSRIAEVALLPAATDPTSYGYDASAVRWSGADMRLYGRNPDVRYHRVFGSGGRYPAIAAGESLTLLLTPEGIALPGEQPVEAGARRNARLALAVASFAPAMIELSSAGGTAERHSLPGGLTELTSAALALPGEVQLRNTGDEPLYLWWGELRDATAPAESRPRDEIFVQVLPQPVSGGPNVTAAIQLHTQALPEGAQKLTGLVTFSHTPANKNDWQQIGQWVFFPSGGHQLRLDADIERMTAALSQDGRTADLFGSAQPAGDGEYEASLLLANNAQIIYGATLWTWTMRDGKATDVASDSVLFDVVPLPQPATAAQADTQDGTTRLRGYTLPRRRARPGETLDLSLVWQSLRKIGGNLSAHVALRDAGGRVLAEQTLPLGKADHGTSTWQEGEVAEQQFKLQLPGDASLGDAALMVELVGPNDRPLPFASGPEPLKLADVTVAH